MAKWLIEQAFPASDVFDILLVSHVAKVAPRIGLRLWSFNHSLFAQVAKVLPVNMLPPALRSYDRAPSSASADPDGGARDWSTKSRRRRSVYRLARPLG